MSERKVCPNLETNKKGCTCPKKDCSRNGFCCVCVEQHRNAGNLPMCMRNLQKPADAR